MWNCRKSVLLPAKRRKAGARPLARVTSRRELGRGERGLRGLRDGPALRAPAPARWPRGSGARHGSAALPGTAQHGPARRGAARAPPQLRPAAGLCAGKTVQRGSGAAPPGGGSEVGGTRLCPPPGTPRTSAAAWRRQRCAPAAVPCRAVPDRPAGTEERSEAEAAADGTLGAGVRSPALPPRLTQQGGKGLSGRPSASRPRQLGTAAARLCPQRGAGSPGERRALKT